MHMGMTQSMWSEVDICQPRWSFAMDVSSAVDVCVSSVMPAYFQGYSYEDGHLYITPDRTTGCLLHLDVCVLL